MCPNWALLSDPFFVPSSQGLTADRLGRRPIDERRVGKVEKVEKNIDGSVTVWRHGSPDTEEWRQINENTWERTR